MCDEVNNEYSSRELSSLYSIFHHILSFKFTFNFTFLLVIHFTFCRCVSFKTALSNDTNFQKQHSVTAIKNFFLIYSYSMINGFSQDNHVSFISNHQDK